MTRQPDFATSPRRSRMPSWESAALAAGLAALGGLHGAKGLLARRSRHARGLGVPAVVNVPLDLAEIENGTLLVADGGTGDCASFAVAAGLAMLAR